jgi:hypothetical protein
MFDPLNQIYPQRGTNLKKWELTGGEARELPGRWFGLSPPVA